MKTTNKILLTTLVLITLAIITLLVIVKIKLIPVEKLHGTGNVAIDTRNIPAFNSVVVTAGIDVSLLQGEETGLTIIADDNLIDLVTTEVDKGVLNISLREKVGDHKALSTELTFTSLESLSAERGATIKSLNTITGEYLNHIIRFGASSDLELDFDSLNLEASTGAKTRLSGKVNKLKVKSSSRSQVNAAELQAHFVEIGASESKNHVFVKNEISLDIKNGALVKYRGTPVFKSLKISSGAEIKAE